MLDDMERQGLINERKRALGTAIAEAMKPGRCLEENFRAAAVAAWELCEVRVRVLLTARHYGDWENECGSRPVLVLGEPLIPTLLRPDKGVSRIVSGSVEVPLP